MGIIDNPGESLHSSVSPPLNKLLVTHTLMGHDNIEMEKSWVELMQQKTNGGVHQFGQDFDAGHCVEMVAYSLAACVQRRHTNTFIPRFYLQNLTREEFLRYCTQNLRTR